MYFTFENDKHENLITCKDINSSGHPRITSSPFAGSFFYGYHDVKDKVYKIVSNELEMTIDEVKNLGVDPYTLMYRIVNKKYARETTPDSNEKYIIPVCVHHDPEDWTGPPHTDFRHPDRKSLFYYLNETYLKKLRNKEAIFLIDQTLEGYQKGWLWKWVHDECLNYGISPEAIVYVTGNLDAPEQYKIWADNLNLKERIKVIAFSNFEIDIRRLANESNLTNDFNSLIEYKKNNVIKTFNCMNKRLRRHRIIFYLYLQRDNLLDKGLISMNSFDDVLLKNSPFTKHDIDLSKQFLPLRIYNEDNTENNDLFYINRIVDRVYKDSWVTVISEASYYSEDQTIFISEKTYKPIACLHPFIILGNKGSLKKLREMGYKTFKGFIDESYDDYEDYERFQAIINSIKKIDSIENKLEWYISMRSILEHNYNTLMNSRNKIYNEYFLNLKSHYDYFLGNTDV